MSNVGLLPGLNQDGWRTYKPEFACAGAGGETQPALDQATATRPFGRYLIQDHASVLVEIQASFTGVATIGAGTAYVFSLPFPANRWTGPGQISKIPLGLGMCYFSIVAPNVNAACTITLADPFASLNGQEDNYVQAYCTQILSWGTATLASTTTTVTHRCGYTPRAEDIEVIGIDVLPSGTAGPPSVQNITSTTFDIVVRTGANNGLVAWKVRGKPPTGTGALLSPTTPWDWGRFTSLGPFGNLFFQFEYEPKR